jgi:hypothetical protein
LTLDEVDWNFMLALDECDALMRDELAKLSQKPLSQEDDPLFHKLCGQYPRFNRMTVARVVRRAEYDEEICLEYLDNPNMLADLEEPPAVLTSSLELKPRKVPTPSGPGSLPQKTPIPVPRSTPQKKTLTVDLHGYRVAEAEDFAVSQMEQVDENIRTGAGPKITKVNFICGRGRHSPNSIPRIRQRLMVVLDDCGYERRLMEANPGILEVLPMGFKFEDLSKPPEIEVRRPIKTAAKELEKTCAAIRVPPAKSAVLETRH